MIRFNILGVALFTFVVFLHSHTEGQVIPMVSIPVVPVAPFAPRPLCNYQMALANQACAYLPFIQIPPPAPRSPYDLPPSDDQDTPEPEPEHRHAHGHGHEHRHRHEHEENPDPDPDRGHDHDHDDHDHDHEHEHEHEHEHKHDHGHRRHHHHHRRADTPVEEQCCKWLAQVDDQCVCELLVHLPPFLARPVHNYAVVIGKACHFTFSCGSGFRK